MARSRVVGSDAPMMACRGGRGKAGVRRSRRRGGRYAQSMTVTARRFGAQSMTAPLRDVLVKRPGRGVRGRIRRPRPRVPPSGRPRRSPSASTTRSSSCWPSLGPRVHVLDAETRQPGPRLHLRPAAGHRPRRRSRSGRASRTGRPSPPRSRPGRGAPRHPDARADRGARHGRGRRHALAAAGPVLHRADAPDERRRARASSPRSSAATSASSTSRTGTDRPS